MNRTAHLYLVLLLSSCCLTGGRGRRRACQIDRPCPSPERLPFCEEKDLKPALDVVAFSRRAASLESQTVTVRGRVQLTTFCTALDCGNARCCNSCGGGAALDLKRQFFGLALDGVKCSGDDSRLCCSHRIEKGQQIVARGVLKRGGSSVYGPSYALLGAKMCRPRRELPEPKRPFLSRIGCYFSRDDDWERTGMKRSPEEAVADRRESLGKRLLASEWLFHRRRAAWDRLDRGLLVELYVRVLVLYSGSANRWGHLWVNGDPGCLGERLISFGARAAPALALALNSKKRLHYEGSREATLGNAQAYLVRDFAAFYLNRICKLGMTRKQKGALSDQEIERVRTRVQAGCR